MVTTTFQNPACIAPKNQNIPPSRETTLCLDLSLEHKKNVLRNENNNNTPKITKNQYWAYLSNINPSRGKTYAMQSDIMSNPNLLNLPRTGGGGLTCN
jgi:hypothetical protein